ncbi:MAG TPA: hypothetical protein VJG30_01435 [Candidatus Nanoarchaeia archaeon]|nr:hypothetical protein [Candidatus Nanoarchaeia archaeon]
MESNQDIIIACTSCSSRVPISQTTYGSSGKNLICFDCYNSIAKGNKPERVVQSADVPDRVSYKCMSCSHSFSRASTFQFGGQCFNCGKKSVQVVETKDIVMKDRKSLLDY